MTKIKNKQGWGYVRLNNYCNVHNPYRYNAFSNIFKSGTEGLAITLKVGIWISVQV